MGWWHAPSGHGRRVPVVLCRPLGWEGEATYHAVLRWAEALVAAGFSVLRFDYDGTGDSPGGDQDPARLEAWKASVHAAIACARELAGAERVALGGMHLGGTLAALVATERDDVDGLVCWGAFATGRAYIRQLRAYRLLNQRHLDPSGSTLPEGEEEAAGYRLTAATVASLGELDLRRVPRRPAPQVLLLGVAAEGGHPVGEGWSAPADLALAEAWRAAGSRVVGGDVEGWPAMMQEPRKSVVSASVLDTIVAFHARLHAERADADAHRPTAQRRSWALVSGAVEEAVCFGEGGVLSGVLTQPLAPREQAPVALFLTTASHHRIGPNRLWTRLSRDLAAHGVQSLRFDLEGVGDSLAPPGTSATHAYSRASVREVRLAMDALQRSTGTRRFVVVGLCSGAYLGYHTARADPRVVGALLVNPQTFVWREGDSLELRRRRSIRSTRYYRKAFFRAETWKRFVRGELHVSSILAVLASRAWERLRVRFRRGLSRGEEHDVGRALEELVERGLQLKLLFSADDQGVDVLRNAAGSSLRTLRGRREFLLDIVDGPEHTFEQLWAQELLATRLVGWFRDRFLVEARAGADTRSVEAVRGLGRLEASG